MKRYIIIGLILIALAGVVAYLSSPQSFPYPGGEALLRDDLIRMNER